MTIRNTTHTASLPGIYPRIARLVLGVASMLAMTPLLAADRASGDRAAIAEWLRQTWEKPHSRLEVDPIVVSGQHAIADWHQGDHAGRALLRRDGSGWVVLLCAGDALRERAFLVEAGVDLKEAADLENSLAEAERRLAPEIQARMSRFKGIVRMRGM